MTTISRNDIKIRRAVNAACVLDGTTTGYVLSDERAINIGAPAILLLTTGDIVRTSPVEKWSKYGSFRIWTKNTEYTILCENI